MELDNITMPVELVKDVEEYNNYKIVVDDAESMEFATGTVHEIDKRIKLVKDFWKEPKARAHELHKMMTTKEGFFLKPLEAAKKSISAEISRYLTEQERIRREAQRKADEEARAALEAQKKAMAERGETEEPIIPVIMPTVVTGIDKTVKTDTGSLTQRAEIEVTVVDVKAVLAGIIAGEIPESVVEISIPKLKQYAKMVKATELPGCRIEEVVKATFRAS
jgi:hypothetical protein